MSTHERTCFASSHAFPHRWRVVGRTLHVTHQVMPPQLHLRDPLYAAILLFIASLQGAALWTADAFWQEKTGEWILAHGQVPHIDVFSGTARGTPWVVQEWLANTLLAALNHIDHVLPFVLMTFVIDATCLLMYARARSANANPQWALIVTAIAIIGFGSFFWMRMFWWSYLLLNLTLWLLEDYQRTPSRRILLLIPLMALWTNLHSGVILGILVIVMFWLTTHPRIAATINRTGHLHAHALSKTGWSRLVLVGALAIAATLATPNGVDQLTYSLVNGTDPDQINQIDEWLSPNFHNQQGAKFGLFMAAMLALLFTRRHIPVEAALLLLGFGAMAFYELRNIPILVVALAPLVAATFVDLPDQNRWIHTRALQLLPHIAWWRAGVALLCLALLGGTVWQTRQHYDTYGGENYYPMAAVDYLVEHPIPGQIFNDYVFGGYLIYRGIPPFVDGRSDLYVKTNIFRDYLDVSNGSVDPDPIFRKYHVTHVLIKPDSYLASELMQRGWTTLYSDGMAVILVPPTQRST